MVGDGVFVFTLLAGNVAIVVTCESLESSTNAASVATALATADCASVPDVDAGIVAAVTAAAALRARFVTLLMRFSSLTTIKASIGEIKVSPLTSK